MHSSDSTPSETEIILNPDGSTYHLGITSDNLADTLLTVGDPERVHRVSQHFDHIEFTHQNREFLTQTGYLGKKRLTVMSTGMGIPNIEILMNELYLLTAFQPKSRKILPESKRRYLSIIRIGTSGSIRPNLPEDSFLISKSATALDGISDFYDFRESETNKAFSSALRSKLNLGLHPFTASADKGLLKKFAHIGKLGHTLTCSGFYAPQGRQQLIKPRQKDLLNSLQNFEFEEKVFDNMEMETAAYYAFGKLTGFKTLSVSAIPANRVTGRFSISSEELIGKLIRKVLKVISTEFL